VKNLETKDALVLLANSNGVSGQENNLHKVIIAKCKLK